MAIYHDTTLYRRLLRQARPYWLHTAGIFLLDLLSTPLTLLVPVPMKIVVDSVIGSHPFPGFLDALLPAVATRSTSAVLIIAVVLIVLIAALRELQTFSSSLSHTYVGEKLVLGFRALLFSHVQRLSLSYHDTKGTADSIYRIQWDAPAIQHIVINGVFPFITAVLTVVAMLYITFKIDWQLALVALAISPILIMLSRIYRQGLRRQSREVKRIESSAQSVVQEVLTAVRVVKAFGQEGREQNRYVRRSSEGTRARVRLALTEGVFGLLIGFTIAVGAAAVVYIGVRHVQSNMLTLGELLLIMGYVAQLLGPLRTISKNAVSLQSHLASAERAFSLLDETPEVEERPDARPLSRALGSVTFRNVSFAYDEARRALNEVSFEVTSGTRLGVAGATGAGKTTLVSLLTRFYDPTSGEILLDGVDLREYKLADLRNQFAIVLQEPVLFSTSIAENIAYGRPSAGYQDIVAAAEAANVHEFIARLPQGYDTLVGERGMRLSGGERQRIGLARAFLKDAPILILDEPTSSVDLKTEAGIMEAMERLMGNRTVFMIAHRLTTLENCDMLLVIEDGRLVEMKSDVQTAVRAVLAASGLDNPVRPGSGDV